MKILTGQELLQTLRKQRKTECFSVINRGKLWYECLTDEQVAELRRWYHDWLDVTETKVVPVAPEWLQNKLEREEQIW